MPNSSPLSSARCEATTSCAEAGALARGPAMQHGQTTRCSFSATLMSPETLNLPIMKPVVGSSSPVSSAARFSRVMAMVQSASRSVVVHGVGRRAAVDVGHAVGAAVELERGVEAAGVAHLGAQGFGDGWHVHGRDPRRDRSGCRHASGARCREHARNHLIRDPLTLTSPCRLMRRLPATALRPARPMNPPSARYRSVFRPGLFAGQVHWVTGGGSGIGRCVAHELASLGATVVISGRTQDKLDRVAAEIAEDGGRCRHHRLRHPRRRRGEGRRGGRGRAATARWPASSTTPAGSSRRR